MKAVHSRFLAFSVMLFVFLTAFHMSGGKAETVGRPCGSSPRQPSALADSSLRRLPSLHGVALMNPETFNGKLMKVNTIQRAAPHALVVVTGWALDRDAMGRAGAVFAEVDGASPRIADYCGDRPDVARFYHNPTATHSQFSVRLPPASINVVHTITFFVVNAARTGKWKGATVVRFH